MPKYLVRHTTLLHNKKTYGEGKEIELTEEQAARIPDFVEPISEKRLLLPKLQRSQQSQTQSPSQTKALKMVNNKMEIKNNDRKNLQTYSYFICLCKIKH